MSMHKLINGQMEQIAAGSSPFNGAFRLGAPDYARMETVNRITADHGTWTADRDGYVNITIQPTANGDWHVICSINNIQVGSIWGLNVLRGVYPVKAGDIVKLNITGAGTATNISCRFIPPAAEPVPLPPSFTPSNDPGYVSVEAATNRARVNADLSTAERLAGYKDDRGKDVYIRTFRGNVPATAANTVIQIPLAPDTLNMEGHFIRAYGEYQRLDMASKMRFLIPYSWVAYAEAQVDWQYGVQGLRLLLRFQYAITNPAQHPYAVTVEYTKE